MLYRFAEALESRSGVAAREYGAAVDLLVHYAGWTDKLAAVLGGVNPVAAPFLSFSTPEPTGVVAVLAPDAPDLLGLVARDRARAGRGQHGRRDRLARASRCARWTSARSPASRTSRAAC